MEDGELNIIRAHTHTIVSMAIIENSDLSFAARGLLIYLLAVTERDGSINTDVLAEQCTEEELDMLIEELVHHRYMTADDNGLSIHAAPQP